MLRNNVKAEPLALCVDKAIVHIHMEADDEAQLREAGEPFPLKQA